MIILRGVNVFPGQIESALLAVEGTLPHYQIVLTREGVLDVMTVEVEMTPGAPADDASRRQKAGDVVRHIKSNIGVTCEAVVKTPGEVPRSQGKAVRVKDLRKKP